MSGEISNFTRLCQCNRMEKSDSGSVLDYIQSGLAINDALNKIVDEAVVKHSQTFFNSKRLLSVFKRF